MKSSAKSISRAAIYPARRPSCIVKALALVAIVIASGLLGPCVALSSAGPAAVNSGTPMPAAVTQEINSMAATIAASIRATPSNLATIDALLAAINGSVASAAANEFVSGSANFASLNAALKAAVVNLFSSDMANLMQQQGIAPNSAAANDIETAALGSSAVANGPSTSAVELIRDQLFEQRSDCDRQGVPGLCQHL